MLMRSVASLLVVLGLTAWITPANASVITYVATNTGGSEWRYDYTVSAEPAEAAIEEFTIFFDLSVFAAANLRSLVSSADWDGLIGVVDPPLPADGFVDFLALSGGVAAGATQGGFSVLFDWFGPGAPGSQAFDIIDASTFTVLRSGFTTPAVRPNVPEPATLLLLALSLGALCRQRRHAVGARATV